MLFCSLIALYVKRDNFESKVFNLLAASIALAALGDLSFALYSHIGEFPPNIIGHYFKLLSFYFIYQAVVGIGFEEPCSLLFRELKHRKKSSGKKPFSSGTSITSYAG